MHDCVCRDHHRRYYLQKCKMPPCQCDDVSCNGSIKHDVTEQEEFIALFPGRSHRQYFIAPVSNIAFILEAMKYQRWERPGNETKLAICSSSPARLILLLCFHPPHHLHCAVDVCSTGISPSGTGVYTCYLVNWNVCAAIVGDKMI